MTNKTPVDASLTPGMPRCLHVAVAVVVDEQGRVLVSQRPAHAHLGGLWEFPGGKLEAGETPEAGLKRELHEELGITVQAARPLIRVFHTYPDKSVLLDVWRVTRYSGEPAGLEGQPIDWIPADKLDNRRFPAADGPIIKAVQLPECCLVTPEPGPRFLAELERALARGISLVQLRVKALSADDYRAFIPGVQAVCRAANARLLLNTDPRLALQLGADGVHLNSERLLACTKRPAELQWVGASCHSQAEVRHAGNIGVDFIVVSPVQKTASHPGAVTLGFDGLRALTELATVPVYALGGMGKADLDEAFRHGAQGIAAIGGLWN